MSIRSRRWILGVRLLLFSVSLRGTEERTAVESCAQRLFVGRANLGFGCCTGVRFDGLIQVVDAARVSRIPSKRQLIFNHVE